MGTDRVISSVASDLADRYARVRARTEWLAEALSAEDQNLQSMSDASPVKWHRAHTTWFFERFVLADCLPGHPAVEAELEYLYNSYYEAVGPRHARDRRGLVSRPSVGEIGSWRERVDLCLLEALAAGSFDTEALRRIEIGLQHEQQHQELLLSDIQHAFSLHPFEPVYRPGTDWQGPPAGCGASQWQAFEGGLVACGHAGDGFAFDNEGPRHQVWLEPFELASELVSERDWLAFIDDDGYRQPRWWCADGWARVQAEDWQAPLYWRCDDGQWSVYSLGGRRSLDGQRAVSHLSWYEADAYARWCDARLPTEVEWEHAAGRDAGLRQLFAALWQWTASPYVPYPGFRAEDGALGEYNGKFMCNQFVLRGGAWATPAGHSRHSYRNFYYPHQRWMFSGVRLARSPA